MTKTQQPVLVLNASYEPINITTVQRAMVLLAKGTAIVQEPSKQFLRTQRVTFPLPSVVRLLSYRNVPRHTRAVSRKNVMIRDGHRCQYCLKTFAAGSLTLDHVTPKSRGGKSTWENLVASCCRCNNLKGDRTPEEARMPLAKTPAKFGVHARHKLLAANDDLWGKYIFC